MDKTKRIIRRCTIGMLVASVYLTSLSTGYTLSSHHLAKSLGYKLAGINSYIDMNREEHEKYLKLAKMHEQKSEKWRGLTESIDLFHKLGLYR